MTLLLEILHMAAEHGDKVVVFSQSILTLDLIEIVLRELSRKATSTATIWLVFLGLLFISLTIAYCAAKRCFKIVFILS